jgi:hypothetical protein
MNNKNNQSEECSRKKVDDFKLLPWTGAI